MKTALGILLMVLAVLSVGAALLCIAVVIIFSDMRSLGAGGSGGITGDALAIIAGFVVGGLLLWWVGRSLRRSAATESKLNL